MPIQRWGKSGFLAYFRPKVSHLATFFWDMDFKFVLQNISKLIGPKLTILASKKHKMAINQNPILPKCQSSKAYSSYIFSMNLSQIFRIDVNMDFAKLGCLDSYRWSYARFSEFLITFKCLFQICPHSSALEHFKTVLNIKSLDESSRNKFNKLQVYNSKNVIFLNKHWNHWDKRNISLHA